MKAVDPNYLRFVVDSLSRNTNSNFSENNLPNGLTGIYQELVDQFIQAAQRQEILNLFTSIALYQDPISISEIAFITGSTKNTIQNFITGYSQYFDKQENDLLTIYHQRFTIFLFQNNSRKELLQINKRILSLLEPDLHSNKVISQIGRHYGIAKEYHKLFHHLKIHSDQKLAHWWIRDMILLLDGILSRQVIKIDFTFLTSILINVLDYSIIKKAAHIIVSNSKEIHWEALNEHFHTTRLQYEIATEFSSSPANLPVNWQEIMMDESLGLSYTFSYVWKYLQFSNPNYLDTHTAHIFWEKSSPYQRIIVIMVWGYRQIKTAEQDWIHGWRTQKKLWPYLSEEFEVWEHHINAYRSKSYEAEFEEIMRGTPLKFHYIFQQYFTLFESYNRLEADINDIAKLETALEIAKWIYRNPSWEVGKLANIILLQKLRNRRTRKDTLKWMDEKWEEEEFYALAEVVFQIQPFLETKDQFHEICLNLAKASSSQLRGSFISDLCVYLENQKEVDFIEFLRDQLIPELSRNADDIWETQEMIRLLNDLSTELGETEIGKVISSHRILSKINNPLTMDYNDFWREAENIYLQSLN